MEAIFDYLDQQREDHLQQLFELLAIPSVSTLASRRRDVQRAADWVAAHLRQIGLEQVQVHPTDGHPIVMARSEIDPAKPTVLIYGHYDVQPAEPLELWHSPPFEPTIRDGRLYARGAADDKGQLFIHLKVLEAFLRVRGRLPLNVRLLIEGEEEIGSPNLSPFLERHAPDLACDVVVVSDTHMQGIDHPSITTGLRGLACAELRVRTAAGDLHSGNYGGAIANPIQVLAELLVACKDPRSGRILIPGFYDPVRELDPAVRQSVAQVPHDEHQFAEEIGASAPFGEEGFSTLERIGARPTFEVNGISGGYSGDGVKTVLPAEAMAKISMRLVAQQDPSAVIASFRSFIEKIAPPHADVSVRPMRDAAQPTLIDPEFPQMRHAAQAVKQVFGREPLYTLEGGSIPVVAEFRRILQRETILLGFGLPDDNLHAPNEKLDLRMLERGLRTVATFFDSWGHEPKLATTG
jgi:acetylornithine deacetylase/succinyl-diaminopimelate desuccinylase-like protein